MKAEGLSLAQAINHFDSDRSGVITRHELNEGFKRMKVQLNEQLVKNIFVILDKNGDNRIEIQEFEQVFAKAMNPKKDQVQEGYQAPQPTHLEDKVEERDLGEDIVNLKVDKDDLNKRQMVILGDGTLSILTREVTA